MDAVTAFAHLPRRASLLLCAAWLGWLPAGVAAQSVSHRGFVETRAVAYPQTTDNDREHVIGDFLARWEPSLRWGSTRADAAFDLRADSNRRVERRLAVSFRDRTVERPALAVRRLSVSWARGPVTLEAGKQFVRWGKTDILIPTDRFAPRDHLTVLDTEVLAVTAARVMLATASDSLEIVYTPRMTPSRMPLLDQRWVVAPAMAQGFSLNDAGADFPGGGQYGARWNHLGRRLEFSVSGFRGFHYLPLLEPVVDLQARQIGVRRRYPQLTSAGADLVVPAPWFAVKAESAWFRSETAGADEYVLYVVQLERQSGEWLFVGGYAGEYLIESTGAFRFAPDRGLARAFVGRASLTIDVNQSLAFEGVARQDGDGFYGRVEYSRAIGPYWRLTVNGGLIRGSESDFLGQFRRNSLASVVARLSF